MMTIKRLKVFPTDLIDHLEPAALVEYRRAGEVRQKLLEKSLRAWLLCHDGVPVFVAGLLKTSMMGSGVEIWFMCCKGIRRVRRKAIDFLRRAIRRIAWYYPHLKITVDDEFPMGVKFAKVLGFVRQTYVRSVENRIYGVYIFNGVSRG